MTEPQPGQHWQLYHDQTGFKLSEALLTEREARDLLKKDSSGTVYAQNSVGDTIETHDGPTTVARIYDDKS